VLPENLADLIVGLLCLAGAFTLNTVAFAIVPATHLPPDLAEGVTLGATIIFTYFFLICRGEHLSDFLVPVCREILSFLNRKELNIFEDYVRKLNEFGIGRFELMRVGREVTILHEGIPVAIYKHYDWEVDFPILGNYYMTFPNEKPNDEGFGNAILVGCLASPIYARLKEQGWSEGSHLAANFTISFPPNGNRQVILQVTCLRNRHHIDYELILPAVKLETDPEEYLVHLTLYDQPYTAIRARVPYVVLAQCGLSAQVRGLLYL
jgi:hypothetical protein